MDCPANAWWKNDAFRDHHTLKQNRFPGADDSWVEDRLFSQLAIESVPVDHPLAPFVRRELQALVPRPVGELAPVLPVSGSGPGGRTVSCRGTTLEFATTGALDRLTFRGRGGSWSRLMDLRYLKYRPLDRKGVVCNESTCPNPTAGAHAPTLLGFRSGSGPSGGARGESCSVVLELGFDESLHREYGAPLSVTAEYTIDPVAKRLNVSLTWRNKTATRMQESIAVFHRPLARAGHRWEMDVLGEWTSPANVTSGGEQYQHAVWTGVRYSMGERAATGAAPQGLWLGTSDAAMACPVLNTVADSALTPESSLLNACFKQDIRQRSGQQQRLTDAMIDGVGISMYANLFTISGYPQWYPFGIVGSNYQEADETTLFRFSIEER